MPVQHSTMSDSEGDIARPDDGAIEDALREIVRDAAKRDEEITVKSARTQAEERLGLDAGFFKDDAKWKARSSKVIQAAFDEPASPVKPVTVTPKARAAPKPKGGTKRKSEETVVETKKRRKQSPVADSEGDDKLTSEPGIEAKDRIEARKEDALSKLKLETKSAATSELSSAPDTEDEGAPAILNQNGKDTTVVKQDDDSSDLSSVIDEPPPKKKRQKKPTSPLNNQIQTCQIHQDSQSIQTRQDPLS